MEAYLQSYPKKETQRLFKRGLNLFVDWYGKSVDEILAERKDDLTLRPNESLIDAKQRATHYEKLLEQFYFWLESEGYDKANTRYNYCKGLVQLFRYYSMSLTLRTNSPINQTNTKIDDFPLKPDHVKKMFHVAKDLRTKLWVSMGNDLGWRISDFLSITRNELPNLNQDAPIEWMRITQKENQISKTCLSKTTVLLLKEYLETFPNSNNDLLFFNGCYGFVNPDTVNMRLNDLAQDAKIELGNLSLSWHCFRKMIISTAKNLSIDPDIIKIMTGKAVEKSMLPYLNGIDVRTAFTKLQTALGITTLTESSEDATKVMTKEIEKLNNALSHVENENFISKTRIENLQKNQIEQSKTTEEQKRDMNELKALVTQLLNHEKDMNFSVLQTPKDKQESEEVLNQREQQFKKIAPEYLHEPQKTHFSTESFKIIDKKSKAKKDQKEYKKGERQ